MWCKSKKDSGSRIIRIFWVAERRRRGDVARWSIFPSQSPANLETNKSGGCAFPDRGKYLNRCAFTHERREGAAIKHAWIRTCSIKMKTRVKISLRSFHHIDPVFLRSDFDVDEMKRN